VSEEDFKLEGQLILKSCIKNMDTGRGAMVGSGEYDQTIGQEVDYHLSHPNYDV